MLTATVLVLSPLRKKIRPDAGRTLSSTVPTENQTSLDKCTNRQVYLLVHKWTSVLTDRSVCLLIDSILTKRTYRIFMKTLSDMYLWTRKSPLNVGSHPDLDPDPGIF